MTPCFSRFQPLKPGECTTFLLTEIPLRPWEVPQAPCWAAFWAEGAEGGGRCFDGEGDGKEIFWAIYNDLSRGHLKWWFSKGIPQNPLNSGLGIILICPDLNHLNQPKNQFSGVNLLLVSGRVTTS